MNDKFSGTRRRRRKPFSNMDQGIFFNASGWQFQLIFTFEEIRPTRVEPIFVLDISFISRIRICVFANQLVFIFNILWKKINSFIRFVTFSFLSKATTLQSSSALSLNSFTLTSSLVTIPSLISFSAY